MKKLEQAITISYDDRVTIKITHVDISQAAINEQGTISSYIPVLYVLNELDHKNYKYYSYEPSYEEKIDIDNHVQDFIKRLVHYKLDNPTSVLNVTE